jgi:hypothetical protein
LDKPTTTTSYVVTQTLCGQLKKDTVRVEVWGVGSNSIDGQAQLYSIAPSPNERRIPIRQVVADNRLVQIEVFEVTGNCVFNPVATFKDGRYELDLSHLIVGMFYIRMQDQSGNACVLKLIRQ